MSGPARPPMKPDKRNRLNSLGLVMVVAILLGAGALFFTAHLRSNARIVLYNKQFDVRFIGFTSGTNHLLYHPRGFEAKGLKMLSRLGLGTFKEERFQKLTREPRDQIWFLLRFKGVETFDRNRLRLLIVAPNGKTNIQEFSYAFPTLTNGQAFAISASLPGSIETSSKTRIELQARSTNEFSRKYTNRIATIRID